MPPKNYTAQIQCILSITNEGEMLVIPLNNLQIRREYYDQFATGEFTVDDSIDFKNYKEKVKDCMSKAFDIPENKLEQVDFITLDEMFNGVNKNKLQEELCN